MTASSEVACSVQWDDAGVSAAGTASQAVFWVALGQPGPWGREAITSSHLPEGVGAELERACAAAGGRLLLIRRPGRHADEHASTASHAVLISGGPLENPWLIEGFIDDPASLLALPWSALLGDDPDAVTAVLPTLEETPTPALLVCTNGRRDVCCAVRGRPVALAAAEAAPGQVWECSHTGGHRFAPTGISLPSGMTFARLTPELAIAALDAERRGEIAPELNHPSYNRGLSRLSPPEQAADCFVREQISEPRIAALRTTRDGDRCTVSHADGRSWELAIERHDGPELKDSCAKLPKTSTYWQVDVVTAPR